MSGGQVAHRPTPSNPTLVMVTDRQDLDGQLFGVFAEQDLLGENLNRQTADKNYETCSPTDPAVESSSPPFRSSAPKREDKSLTLSDRHNIVVICDEAHRTQYGFKGRLDTKRRDQIRTGKGLRDALPEATFLAFTGTPISQDDRDTQAVLGITSRLRHPAGSRRRCTVPIYYES